MCAHSGKVQEQTATKSIFAFRPLSRTTASQRRSYLRKNTNACTPVRLAVEDLNNAFPLRVDLARSSGVTGSVPSLKGAALGSGVAMADAVESSPTDEPPRLRGTRDGDPVQRTRGHFGSCGVCTVQETWARVLCASALCKGLVCPLRVV
jgi:hypothetical protein